MDVFTGECFEGEVLVLLGDLGLVLGLPARCSFSSGGVGSARVRGARLQVDILDADD